MDDTNTSNSNSTQEANAMDDEIRTTGADVYDPTGENMDADTTPADTGADTAEEEMTPEELEALKAEMEIAIMTPAERRQARQDAAADDDADDDGAGTAKRGPGRPRKDGKDKKFTANEIQTLKAIAGRHNCNDASGIIAEIAAVFSGEDPQTVYKRAIACKAIPAPANGEIEDITGIWESVINAYVDTIGRPTIDDLLDRRMAATIKTEVLSAVKLNATLINTTLGAGEKYPIPKRMSGEAAAILIAATGDTATTPPIAEKDGRGAICFYHHTGPKAGTWAADYTAKEEITRRIAANLGVSLNEKSGAIADRVRDLSPEIKPNKDSTLIPVADGVIDISQVTPIPAGPVICTMKGFHFTPYLLPDGTENPAYLAEYREKGINFTYKLATKYNPQAANVILTGKDGYNWSVDSHLETALDGNAAQIRTFWETLNFAIRHYNPGNDIYFIDGSRNQQGGGAKSTTAEMIGYVLGEHLVSYTENKELTEKFGLSDIYDKNLIIGMEDTSNHAPVKNTDVTKKIARGEVLRYEEKYKTARGFRFEGLKIQCANRLPKFAEKGNSLFRTWVVLEFPAMLAATTDRKYIARDFIKEPEVREYLLLKALSLGPIREFNPDYKRITAEYIKKIQSGGSTVFSFMNELQEAGINGDRIPREVLWDTYRGPWATARGIVNRCNWETFCEDLDAWTGQSGEWEYQPKKSGRLRRDAPAEWFLNEFPTQWTDRATTGGDAAEWIDTAKGTSGKTFKGFLIRRAPEAQTQTTPAPTVNPDAEREQTERDYILFRLAWYRLNVVRIGWDKISEDAAPTLATWIRMGKPLPRINIGPDEKHNPIDIGQTIGLLTDDTTPERAAEILAQFPHDMSQA